MKLYLAQDNQWHIAVQKTKASKYRFIPFCNKNLKRSAWTCSKTIFNFPDHHLKAIPLFKENICPECYKYDKENINQEIIRFKLGIK